MTIGLACRTDAGLWDHSGVSPKKRGNKSKKEPVYSSARRWGHRFRPSFPPMTTDWMYSSLYWVKLFSSFSNFVAIFSSSKMIDFVQWFLLWMLVGHIDRQLSVIPFPKGMRSNFWFNKDYVRVNPLVFFSNESVFSFELGSRWFGSIIVSMIEYWFCCCRPAILSGFVFGHEMNYWFTSGR